MGVLASACPVRVPWPSLTWALAEGKALRIHNLLLLPNSGEKHHVYLPSHCMHAWVLANPMQTLLLRTQVVMLDPRLT